MTQESEPKALIDWRSWWPWAAAAGWLIMIFLIVMALGGFRDLFVDHGATATAENEAIAQIAQETKVAQQNEIAAAVLSTLTAQPTSTPTDKPTETSTATVRPSPTNTPTPDLTATRQVEASLVAEAVAATEAAKPTDTAVPTATSSATHTPTPDVAVTEAALRSLVVEAVAATEAAKPTDTPMPTATSSATHTPTPDVAVTEAALRSLVAEAVAATEAAKPTDTAVPTATSSATHTSTPDVAVTEAALRSLIDEAVALTEAAKPTDTPMPTATSSATHTPTPDVAVTEAALRSLVVEAVAATEAAKPTDTPMPTATSSATHTSTPDVAVTEAALRSLVAEAVAATEAAKPTDTPMPTATSSATHTPTPDVAVTEAALRSLVAEAVAATEAAKPTDTPMPTATSSATYTSTPDVAVTEAALRSLIVEAVAATEAAKPTDTPMPTATSSATHTSTPDVAVTEAALKSLVVEAVAATLTAQLTSTQTPIPALDWPLVLSDPFVSNEHGWPVEESKSDLGRVSRQIAAGVYRWDIEATQGLLVLSHPNAFPVSDFYAAVEVEKLAGPTDVEYGLVFREVDRDNFYSFGIRDGQFAVFRRLNGEWTALIDWIESTVIRPNEGNKLAVWGRGAKFAFFINDHFVGEVEDRSLPAGNVGLLTEAPAESRLSLGFDEFELRTDREFRLPTPAASFTRDAVVLEDREQQCLEENSPIFPKGTLLICDSFNSFWNVQDSDTEQLKLVRTVEDGKYRWSIETENGVFSQSSPNIGLVNDFYLSAEMQQLDGPDDGERGLMFRKVDDDNLYTFSVRNDGFFGVFGVVNGEWTTVVDWTPSPLVRPGEMARLAARSIGRHTAFFINDQRVAESDAIVPVEGEVGIIVSMGAGTQGVFEFDNFELRTPASERPRLLARAAPDAFECAHDSIWAPAGWPIVFCNSFESTQVLNRLSWPIGRSSNKFADVQRQIASGKYVWELKAHQGVFSSAISGVSDVTDFYLTVQGQAKSGSRDLAYGVLFRYVDSGNFYFFEVSDNGFYQFSIKSSGEWETLVPWTEHDAILTGKQQNRITVNASGDEFQFYINDERVLDYSDDRLTAGALGLAVELFKKNDKGNFEWDNFGVWVPTEELSETERAAGSAQPEPAEMPVVMTTFRSEPLGIELEFPSGWSYFDVGDPPLVLFGWFQGSMEGLKDGAGLIVGMGDEFADADVSSLIEDLQEELDEKLQVEAVEPRSIDDNLAEGVRFDVSIPEISEFMAGQRVTGVMYVFSHDSVGYLVVGISPDLSAWEAYEHTFNTIIDSIVLTDLPTPTPTPTWPPTNTPTVSPTPLPTLTATPTSVPTFAASPTVEPRDKAGAGWNLFGPSK